MAIGIQKKIAAFSLLLPLTFVAVAAQPASADPSSFPFAYKITATTHLKKLNQTVTVPPGTFSGAINFDSMDPSHAQLVGKIALPPATIRLKLAGIVPLVRATVKITETKPVSGTVDLTVSPFPVVATATFNIRITSAYAIGGIIPVNLVGNSCVTSKPVVVTMSGTALPGSPSTFSGPFTIPPLKTCGVATAALNQVIPGPGNTFTAHANP